MKVLNHPCFGSLGEPDDEPYEPRKPRTGGPERCPRPCSECSEGEHHFSDAMIDMADDEDDLADGMTEERTHPAALAGCDAWYVCKHCDAWREYTGEEDEDDPGSEERDADEKGRGRYSSGDMNEAES